LKVTRESILDNICQDQSHYRSLFMHFYRYFLFIIFFSYNWKKFFFYYLSFVELLKILAFSCISRITILLYNAAKEWCSLCCLNGDLYHLWEGLYSGIYSGQKNTDILSNTKLPTSVGIVQTIIYKIIYIILKKKRKKI